MKDIASPALLWIDDEKSPSDPDIKWLAHEGFRIDCAVTGAEGLALARNGDYQVILLDLRLAMTSTAPGTALSIFPVVIRSIAAEAGIGDSVS